MREEEARRDGLVGRVHALLTRRRSYIASLRLFCPLLEAPGVGLCHSSLSCRRFLSTLGLLEVGVRKRAGALHAMLKVCACAWLCLGETTAHDTR